MKHYIYIDKEMLDSYISQIYGGIVKNEKNELSYEHKDESSIKSPEMEIKSKIEGGISKLAQANIEGTLNTGIKTNTNSNAELVNKVVEKIFHDNLLDNIIEYFSKNQNIITDIKDIKKDAFVQLKIPFKFYNNEFFKRVGGNKFKTSFEKLLNIINSNSSMQFKDAKKGLETLDNFANLLENLNFPEQFICAEKLIIPLKTEYFKETPKEIEFKYGGYINIIGKVTKNCSSDENEIEILNKPFSDSLVKLKNSFNTLILPEYNNCYIVTPLALYFD